VATTAHALIAIITAVAGIGAGLLLVAAWLIGDEAAARGSVFSTAEQLPGVV
jgi:hypothetical protein